MVMYRNVIVVCKTLIFSCILLTIACKNVSFFTITCITKLINFIDNHIYLDYNHFCVCFNILFYLGFLDYNCM